MCINVYFYANLMQYKEANCVIIFISYMLAMHRGPYSLVFTQVSLVLGKTLIMTVCLVAVARKKAS